jgi:hypothetical protein
VAKAGRPSSFDAKIAAKICELIATDNSLASICSKDGMPSTTTVYRWRDSNDQFRADYARAREEQGHFAADTVGDIRRKILAGEIDPQTGKIAADLAKWEASKRAARDYGDKVDVTSGGEPLTEGLDSVARATRLASILADIEKRREADDAD